MSVGVEGRECAHDFAERFATGNGEHTEDRQDPGGDAMRGRLIRAKLLVRGAVVLSVAMVVAGCNGTSWTMFGFDAIHSEDNAQETVIGAANVGTLAEAGSSAPVGGPITSAPTIANGILYTTADVGSNDVGTLYAYSATGGTNCSKRRPKLCRPLWSATPAGGHKLLTSPAVDAAAGIVYVGSADGVLYAYAATTGALEWRSPLMSGSVGASPTVTDEYVYVSIVYGWTFAYPLTTGYDGKNPSCATHDGQRTCRPEWKYSTPGDVFSSPAVANGILYSNVSSPTDRLYAYDDDLDGHCSGTAFAPPLGATCTNPLWTASTDGGKSSPAVVDGTVYLGSLTSGLLAFSATGSKDCSGVPYSYLQGMTCTPLWVGTTGRQDGSSPAVANGVVYIGSADGHLDAFGAAGGNLLWTAPTGGAIDSAPIVADGVVYVGCSNHHESAGQTCSANLFAFGAAGGNLLWTGNTDGTNGTIDSSPVVVDATGKKPVGALYAGSSTGSSGCVGTSACSGRLFAFSLR
jgi:outer membrane protein assembly factor BamB